MRKQRVSTSTAEAGTAIAVQPKPALPVVDVRGSFGAVLDLIQKGEYNAVLDSVPTEEVENQLRSLQAIDANSRRVQFALCARLNREITNRFNADAKAHAAAVSAEPNRLHEGPVPLEVQQRTEAEKLGFAYTTWKEYAGYNDTFFTFHELGTPNPTAGQVNEHSKTEADEIRQCEEAFAFLMLKDFLAAAMQAIPEQRRTALILLADEAKKRTENGEKRLTTAEAKAKVAIWNRDIWLPEQKANAAKIADVKERESVVKAVDSKIKEQDSRLANMLANERNDLSALEITTDAPVISAKDKKEQEAKAAAEKAAQPQPDGMVPITAHMVSPGIKALVDALIMADGDARKAGTSRYVRQDKENPGRWIVGEGIPSGSPEYVEVCPVPRRTDSEAIRTEPVLGVTRVRMAAEKAAREAQERNAQDEAPAPAKAKLHVPASAVNPVALQQARQAAALANAPMGAAGAKGGESTDKKAVAVAEAMQDTAASVPAAKQRVRVIRTRSKGTRA